MSINFNVFESGLDGGTVVLTGNQNNTSTLTGNFKGFRVANQCFITSILNQSGVNVISNILYNGTFSDILGIQLNTGDTIAPYGNTTHFTNITLTAYSNRSQIVAYNTGSL